MSACSPRPPPSSSGATPTTSRRAPKACTSSPSSTAGWSSSSAGCSRGSPGSRTRPSRCCPRSAVSTPCAASARIGSTGTPGCSSTSRCGSRCFRMRIFGVNAEFEVAPFIDVGKVFNSREQFLDTPFEVNPGVGFRGLAPPSVVGHIEFGVQPRGAGHLRGPRLPLLGPGDRFASRVDHGAQVTDVRAWLVGGWRSGDEGARHRRDRLRREPRRAGPRRRRGHRARARPAGKRPARPGRPSGRDRDGRPRRPALAGGGARGRRGALPRRGRLPALGARPGGALPGQRRGDARAPPRRGRGGRRARRLHLERRHPRLAARRPARHRGDAGPARGHGGRLQALEVPRRARGGGGRRPRAARGHREPVRAGRPVGLEADADRDGCSSTT